MSRPLTVILAALCVGAIVVAVLVVGPESSPSTTTERTVTATKGVVQTTVSGSGNLAPAKQLDLNFGVAGTVTKVYVKAGQKVTQGQILARVDDADAQVALDEAQATLDSAQADLEAAQSASTDATVAATADDQVTYLSVADTTTPPQTTTTPQTATTPQTTTTTTPQSSGSQQQQAQSSAASTQTAAQKAAAIATAQASVDKAQLAVQNAEQDLADTVLRAPSAGTITAVSGAAGDAVSAGSSGASDSASASDASATGAAGGASSSASSAFITLAKLDRMQLSVSFTESDIGQVKVGQSATVSLSALTDVQLSGRVTQVAVLGDSSGDVVSYPVTILLDQNARGVKAGMTATAEVIVKQASGVTLPSQAVTGRGTTGVVMVKADGQTVSKQVGIGLQGDSSTIITSGLAAGDEVVIQSTPTIGGTSGAAGQQGSSAAALGQRLSGGATFGGGGGGFPAGGPPAGGGGFGGPGG